MQELVLATNNKGKLQEVRSFFATQSIDWKVYTLAEVGISTLPPETGVSFQENALIKADYVMNITNLPALADDSGICVDIMHGMPGIFSARWAGNENDSQKNRALLLAQLQDIQEPSKRKAAFVCNLTLVRPGAPLITVEEYWHGTIAMAEKGSAGFGYDAIFAPAETPGSTAAEITPELKAQLSHRGKALQVLGEALKKI